MKEHNIFIHLLLEIHGYTEHTYELALSAKKAEISTLQDCDNFLSEMQDKLSPESIDKVLDVRNKLDERL